jgi:predicted metal-dependent hydrolase
MHGMVEPAATPLSQLPAAENDDFLFGVDLFNAGYYWEAHTRWERLWGVENEPRLRRFLQSIIQTAAACLKVRQEQKGGARKLMEKARLESFEGRLLGIDARALARATMRFVENGEYPPGIEIGNP